MRLQVNSRHIYSKNGNKISKYTASFAIFLEKFLKKFSTISRIREPLKLSLKRIWPSRAERKLTLITRNSDPCGEDEWNGVDFLSTPRGMGKKEVAWSIAARSRLRVGEKREERHPPGSKRSHVSHGVRHLLLHHYKAISAPPFVDVSRAVETALYLPLPRTRDVPRLLPVLGQKSPRSTRKKGRDKWLAKRTSFSFLRLFRIVRPGWNGTSRTLTRRWSSSRMRGTRFHAISRSGDSFLIFQSRRYLIIRCWSLSSGILTGFSLWIEITKLKVFNFYRYGEVKNWNMHLFSEISFFSYGMKGYLRTHVKFWKPVIPPDVVSLLVGERKEVWNVKVDGSCERNSPRCIIFHVGQFSQVRGKNFPFLRCLWNLYLYFQII